MQGHSLDIASSVNFASDWLYNFNLVDNYLLNTEGEMESLNSHPVCTYRLTQYISCTDYLLISF